MRRVPSRSRATRLETERVVRTEKTDDRRQTRAGPYGVGFGARLGAVRFEAIVQLADELRGAPDDHLHVHVEAKHLRSITPVDRRESIGEKIVVIFSHQHGDLIGQIALLLGVGEGCELVARAFARRCPCSDPGGCGCLR